MRRIGAIALLLCSLAFKANAQGDLHFVREWPCDGGQYSNAPLIYEGQFPGAHPGLEVLTGVQVNTYFTEVSKRAEAEVVVVLSNRRGNRPEGFEQLLLRSASGHTSSHFTPTKVKLLEGDVVTVAVTCNVLSKKPQRRAADRVIGYSVDFFGFNKGGHGYAE